MALTVGQFIIIRSTSPDTHADPYDPKRESILELVLPGVPFQPAGPSPLPPPPPVGLSGPGALPPPPNVTASTPAVLPPPPPFSKEPIDPIPGPPPVQTSVPSALPPPPAVPKSVPGALPPPPPVPQSVPGQLPPPPAVPKSVPLALPPVPPVQLQNPAQLPPPPVVQLPVQVVAHPPPDFTPLPNAVLPDPPVVNPDTGYKVLGGTYSPVIGAADPGSLAGDPFLYERSIERTLRLPAGKLAVHALTQVGLFAQNVYGNVWNPAMIDPPPMVQNGLKPAIDLGFDGKTEERQIQIASMVDEAMDPGVPKRLMPQQFGGGVTLRVLPPSTSLLRAFENTKNAVLGIGGAIGLNKDPIAKAAFADGIIPMRLPGDGDFGFRTFQGGPGAAGDTTDDDSVYVPLCFTDLRPVGNTYCVVYLRPLITNFSENFSPEWNKTAYLGRVDPVATYGNTGRSISLGLKLIAFGPEDVRTIYQKLNWLTSMVYPEYDSNLAYKSGPVVRLRIGDIINAVGTEGARGLPGIIESLDFDYTDKPWELRKGFKVPREIDVTLTFTILHDVPIGRGLEGAFGGLGKIDPADGTFSVKDNGQDGPDVNLLNFRTVGEKTDLDYGQLGTEFAAFPGT